MSSVASLAFVVLVVVICVACLAFLMGRSRHRRRAPRHTGAARAGSSEAPRASSPTPSAQIALPPGLWAHPSAFVITATNRSLANQQFPIMPAGLRIGRGSDNNVVVDELMVSRRHAEIVERDGTCIVRDLGSTNGTFVDGLRVYERRLQPGNRISVGLAEFVFHPAGLPIPPPFMAPPLPSAGFGAGPGQPFDGYFLDALIGGGGMAQVYRATTPTGRTVAIKIPTIANDPYLMRKFVQEGEALGRLFRGHPHIVQVEHFGFTRDREPYIVMEYIDGGSLRERLRRPMSEEDIRRIVGQTCLGLAFAHQNAIVHRDIKPENILLTAGGQAKVADFGIACNLSGFTSTIQGPVGTPDYMSPEQVYGDERPLPAADVYAVGVVLYELLTGRVPFPRRLAIMEEDKQAQDVLNRHRCERPVPPGDVRPSISPKLGAVAMKALEKKPEKRYRNGAEMAAALDMKPVKVPTPVSGPRANLMVIQGVARGQSFPVAGEAFEITRQQLDPSNMFISRRHAVVRRRGAELWLEDTSVNGTWVNDIRVRGELMLGAGDCIRIADLVLRLET